MVLWATGLLVLLGAASAARSGEEAGTPVERVVKLLEELKEKITKDGKAEQELYDKYACWCEKTTERKSKAIEDGRAKVQELGNMILKLKGEVATLTGEIKELNDEIAKTQAEIDELTAIRKNENEAFMKESTEMGQAIAALEKAIIVLAKATAPEAKPEEKEASLLQGKATAGAAMQKAAEAVKAAIAMMPSTAQLPPDQAPKVMAFLGEASRAGARVGYAPQSATVQGILKEMYGTFTDDLESMTTEEAKRNRLYEEVVAVKEQKILDMKATLEKKEKEKAEAETMLADAQQEFDDTTEQLAADVEFFDVTKKACQAKSAEWSERKKNRDMELEGIEKALEILTSDEAKKTFSKSMGKDQASFLQTSSFDVESAPAMKAYRALKIEATRTHSLRLAALAASVRTAKHGHFDEVIKAINDMIEVLKAEEVEDIKQRDHCKEEYTKVNSTIEDLKWKLTNNAATIEKLEAMIKDMEDDKKATLEAIEDMEKEVKDMEEQRIEDNTGYVEAKKDDKAAIELLESAKEALKTYYEKNKIELGPVQGSSKLLQEDPEFEISEDQAPDATFSKKGSRKNDSKGIISIIQMIIEDLEGDIQNSMQAEEEAQLDFEKSLAAAKKYKAELEDKVTSLKEEIASTQDKLSEEKEKEKDNEGDKTDEEKYEEEIKPDCDWILENFETRMDKRRTEMEGLTTARQFLEGYSPEASLLQGRFDDGAFPGIGFRGLSFLQRRPH